MPEPQRWSGMRGVWGGEWRSLFGVQVRADLWAGRKKKTTSQPRPIPHNGPRKNKGNTEKSRQKFEIRDWSHTATAIRTNSLISAGLVVD